MCVRVSVNVFPCACVCAHMRACVCDCVCSCMCACACVCVWIVRSFEPDTIVFSERKTCRHMDRQEEIDLENCLTHRALHRPQSNGAIHRAAHEPPVRALKADDRVIVSRVHAAVWGVAESKRKDGGSDLSWLIHRYKSVPLPREAVDACACTPRKRQTYTKNYGNQHQADQNIPMHPHSFAPSFLRSSHGITANIHMCQNKSQSINP